MVSHSTIELTEKKLLDTKGKPKNEDKKSDCTFVEYVHLVTHSNILSPIHKLQLIRDVYTHEEELIHKEGKDQDSFCDKFCGLFSRCFGFLFRSINFKLLVNYPEEQVSLISFFIWLIICVSSILILAFTATSTYDNDGVSGDRWSGKKLSFVVPASIVLFFCTCCCCYGRCCWEIGHGKCYFDATAWKQVIYRCYALIGTSIFSCYQTNSCCSKKWSSFVIGLIPLSSASKKDKVFVSKVSPSETDIESMSYGVIGIGEILPIPLSTPLGMYNYSYIIIDLASGHVGLIDPAVPEKVLLAFEQLRQQHLDETSGRRKLKITKILTTHKHHDHAGGNKEILKRFPNQGITVVGGKGERVSGVTYECEDGEILYLGVRTRIRCILTSAHTKYHMSYYITYIKQSSNDAVVWSADTSEISHRSNKLSKLKTNNNATSKVDNDNCCNPSYPVISDKPKMLEKFLNPTAKIGLFLNASPAAAKWVTENNQEQTMPNAFGLDFVHSTGIVFTGDHLFIGGMGAIFEGSEKEWWQGAEKLMKLPRDTLVCVGHEYTESFAPFASWLEPNNAKAKLQLDWVLRRRYGHKKAMTTVPSTIGREIDTNAYLRCGTPELKLRLGMKQSTDPVEVLCKLMKISNSTATIWNLPDSGSIIDVDSNANINDNSTTSVDSSSISPIIKSVEENV